MTLHETGDQVHGTYVTDNGRLSATLRGGVLEGYWAEDASDRPCNEPGFDGRRAWGRVRFTFVGDRFTGTWSYCDAAPDGGSWTGTRVDTSGGGRTAPAPPAPQPAAGEPFWEYVRTESGVRDYAGGCYPDRLIANAEGAVRLAVYFSPDCADERSPRPLPESTYLFEWSPPPKIILPGKPFDFVLQTTLVANTQPANTYNGYNCIGLNGVTIPPVDRRCTDAQANILGNPHHAGESVTWNNLQRPAGGGVAGPPEWWGTDPRHASPEREARVDVLISGSSTIWYSYVYRLVSAR